MKWNIFKRKEQVRDVTIYKLSTMNLTQGCMLYLKDMKAFEKFVYDSGVDIIWEYDGYRYVFIEQGLVGVKIGK